MPRRAQAAKREISPDAKYRSTTVSRLIVKVMQRGKKRTAEKIVYGALDKLGQHVSKDPVAALEQAVRNATPLLQVKPRRVGGATYQVPVEVEPERGLSLAMRWIIGFARARSGRSTAEKLAAEVIDASQGQGASIKKRQDTHKMAEANKAFAHFRW